MEVAKAWSSRLANVALVRPLSQVDQHTANLINIQIVAFINGYHSKYRTLQQYWLRLVFSVLSLSVWLRNATESRSWDFDLPKILNCRHKKLNKWVLLIPCLVVVCVVICRGYKLISIVHRITMKRWSRSLAWRYYGPNFAGFLPRFLLKFQGGTNASLLSGSVIVQFLSLLSGWLSSHSVSLISKAFLWSESCLCLAQNFCTGMWLVYQSRKLHSALYEIVSLICFKICFLPLIFNGNLLVGLKLTIKLPLYFLSKLSHVQWAILQTCKIGSTFFPLFSNLMPKTKDISIFSTFKHTDPHAFRIRSTLKDGVVHEHIFHYRSFRELKIAKELNDLAKVLLKPNQKSNELSMKWGNRNYGQRFPTDDKKCLQKF